MSFEYTFDGMNLTFDYVGNPADDPFGGRRGDFDTVTYVLSYDSVWMEGGNLMIELSSTVAYTGNFELNGSNDSTGAFKATQTIISVTEHLTGLRGVLSRVDTIGPWACRYLYRAASF